MDRLFTSANLYYAVLERFGPVFWFKSVWAWILVVASGALLWGFWQYVLEFKTLRAPLDWPVLYIILPEILLLVALDRVRDTKMSAALSRINAIYNKDFTSVREGRRFLLTRFFGRKESEYLAFADEIEKAMVYREQLRIQIPTRFGDAARLIYDPDSKQRIYALLIVIASALTALAIREEAGLSNVFELFDLGARSIFSAWLMLTIFLALSLSVLLVIRIGIFALIAYLLVLFYGKSARDPMTLRYLQRDLLNFHRFIHLKATVDKPASS